MMSARAGGQCFYCLHPMSIVTRSVEVKLYPRARTMDHIFPRAEVMAIRPTPRPAWLAQNTVAACRSCNNYKGRLMPLDWLVIMPSPLGASRLAERLIALGVPSGEVDAALARRKPL